MDDIDLNLLVALDALLAEGSVTRAAHRLGLSASAMSRALTRLRSVTGDPLLVRAGRGLVPTPHGQALRDRVRELTREVHLVLRPLPRQLDLAALRQTFTIRANEAFIEFFCAPLFESLAAAAPRARLHFVAKTDKAPEPLREGRIDLEIGVVETSAPELRTRMLFRDRLVGIARTGHPLLAARNVTARRFAACRHVAVEPKGRVRPAGGDVPVGSPRQRLPDASASHALDEALARLGLQRDVPVVVPEFPDAIRLVANSDLLAVLPRSCLGNALAGDRAASLGVVPFELPVATPAFTISAIWHPRLDADPAQRWLRERVITLCRRAYPLERGASR